MSTAKFSFLLAIAIAARSAAAQAPQDRDPPFQIQVDVAGKTPKERGNEQWAEIRSRNFVIAGDADEKHLRMAASELELFRQDFAGWFPGAKRISSVATRVLVFRDRESSYFQPGVDLNYIVLGAGEKLSRDILREYTRTLIRDSTSPLPRQRRCCSESRQEVYILSRFHQTARD